MSTRLQNETNTDRIASKDRGVAGRQPDGTSASGGISPSGGGGGSNQAPLPLLTDPGIPDINVDNPGAGSGYSVYVSVNGAPATTHTVFPFIIATGGASVPIYIYANQPGFSQSPVLNTSWNDLFL